MKRLIVILSALLFATAAWAICPPILQMVGGEINFDGVDVLSDTGGASYYYIYFLNSTDIAFRNGSATREDIATSDQVEDLFGINNSDRVEIYNNDIGTTTHNTMTIDGGSQYLWIHGNTFTNKWRHAIGPGNCYDVIIENNDFHNIGEEGLSNPNTSERYRPVHTVEPSRAYRLIVRNNRYYKCQSVISYYKDSAWALSDIFQYHNSGYQPSKWGLSDTKAGTGSFFYANGGTVEYFWHKNNILFDSESTRDIEWNGNATITNLIWNSNLISDENSQTDIRVQSNYDTSISSFNNRSYADSNIAGDPLFSDVSTDVKDLTLQAGSPCVDAGEYLATIVSVNGNFITVGTREAYQFAPTWSIPNRSAGDTIYDDDGNDAVVVDIFAHNIIQVDDATGFTTGDGITTVNVVGSGPDIGAYEQSSGTGVTFSNGSPSGTLSSGTTSETLSVDSSDDVTAKYDTSDVAYGSMSGTFDTTGGTSHSEPLTGLSEGSYVYYVRGPNSTSSYIIAFSIDPGSTNLLNTNTYIQDSDTNTYGSDNSLDKLWDGCTETGQDVYCTMGGAGITTANQNYDLGADYDITDADVFGDASGSWVCDTWSLKYKLLWGDSWTTEIDAQDCTSNDWVTNSVSFTARYLRTEFTASTDLQVREVRAYGSVNSSGGGGGGGAVISGGGVMSYSSGGAGVIN
jgi:hypothetical protein